MALLDLCARHSDAEGRAPALLYTRDIAEQVAVLYWPQVIPYRLPGTGSAVELRQITLPRAAIVQAVSAFRRGRQPRARHRGIWPTSGCWAILSRCWDQVEVIVAAQPLPRLQAVGSAEAVFPFLYELSWGPRESFSVARLDRHGPWGPEVQLLPGAGDELLRLGPLIRSLSELHWARVVAEINGVAQAELDLHRHLFGPDRVTPPRSSGRHRSAAGQPVFLLPRSSGGRSSSHGSAAASMPSRTWCWRIAAMAAAAAVGGLIGGLGDDGFHGAPAQAGTGSFAGVGLVAEQSGGDRALVRLGPIAVGEPWIQVARKIGAGGRQRVVSAVRLADAAPASFHLCQDSSDRPEGPLLLCARDRRCTQRNAGSRVLLPPWRRGRHCGETGALAFLWAGS